MHVVEVADSRFPIAEPFAGGMQSLTWHLITGLRRRGVRVSVFAGSGSDDRLDAQVITTLPLELSESARTDVSMGPEAWVHQHHAYLQLLLALAKRRDVDVVHNNSLHYLPVAMASSLPVQMVTTLHTPPTPWLESAVRLAEPPANQFVAVSAFTRSQWSHVTAAKVIPNGVDPRCWPFGQGGRDLVWFGRIAPEKAPSMAIDIARRAGRHIRLAGPVTDRAYWAREIRGRLGDDAEYVGHLSQRQLGELVGSSALCLVTPTWDEPYGLVAAESLACGTPVLAFDRGGIAEVVDASCARMVTAGDIAGGAGVVAEAAALDRRAARHRATVHCSLDRMLDRYLEVLETAAGRTPAA
jgi:glycosyltransferase involved in cell wall biosynthesis